MKSTSMARAVAVLIATATATISLAGSSASQAAGTADRTSRPNLGLHGLVLQGSVPTDADWREIGRARVGTIRFAIPWHTIERRKGVYSWERLDPLVRRAVGSGASVIPFVWGTPRWINSDPGQPPLGRVSQPAWRNFLQAVVRRYKPGSSFWRRGSGLGIGSWQIWNEVNHEVYWRPRPTPVGYAKLLDVSAKAIREVAPQSEIVLSGLTPAPDAIPPVDYLEDLIRIPGVTGFFDTVALHPYARDFRNFKEQIKDVRRSLRALDHNELPLRITEFGWGSSGPAGVGRAGSYSAQATLLKRSYRKIASSPRWRVKSASWYGWRDTRESLAHCSFCQSIGVRHAGGAAKPAWDGLVRSIRANHAGKLARSPGR